MKLFATALLFVSFSSITKAQTPVTPILADNDVNTIFTPAVKKEFKILFPIFRVYSFTDKSGQYYTVLTESRDSLGKKKDTISYKIKAYTFKNNGGKLSLVWELSDAKQKKEQAIWFWSRYCGFAPTAKDGAIDPIIIYGTSGPNDFEDGRVLIAVYHNGQKIMIHHQNGTLDHERKLQVEAAFYTLPKEIQKAVTDKMVSLSGRMQALFPVDWQKAMAAKKTLIKN
jgi:hypothetical protein